MSVVPTIDDAAPVRARGPWSAAWGRLRRRPVFLFSAAVVGALVLMSLFPGLLTSEDPRDCVLSRGSDLPSWEHPFGFDRQGCDYLSRVVHGARASLGVGVMTVVGAAGLGVVVGALAGWYGGWIDTVLSRLTDIWLGIPAVLGAIVALSVVEELPWLGGRRGTVQVAVVLAALAWPPMARLVRAGVLEVRGLEYVQAARTLGATDRRILARHVLPNALGPLVVYATITVGIVIAAEATLSYLGLGLQTPAISWGLMLSTAEDRIRTSPHLLLFPGAFLSVTVLAFVLLGDALRDALDPRAS